MTNNFNLPEAPIQNDDGILTFSHENTEFVVDVNSEKSREKCSEELNRISGKHYEWCKETEGKNHWVLYDTAMYSKVYGGDDYNALTYNFGCGLAPIIPINATSCSAMFEKCEDILDLSQFNTHNIVTMSDMFAYYRGTELDASMLDTKAFRVVLGGIIHYNSEYGVAPFMPVNATTCYKMFSDITEDVLISFYNFNTENIINMDRMFEGCKSRLQLNLMCFNTKKVERMYRMFADCPKIELLDIRSFDLSSTTTLREMFSCDTSLSTIGISGSALAQIYRKEVVIKNIFSKCTNLRNIITESGEAVLQEPLRTEYSIATRHEILDGSTDKYESRYSRREIYEALTQNDLQNALAQEDPLTLVKQNSKTLDNRMYIAQLKLKGPKDFTIGEKVNLLALYAKKGEVVIKNLRITKNTLNTWKQQISRNTYNRYNKIKVSPNIALTRPIQNDDSVLALCIDPSQSYNYCNNVYNLRMQQDIARCKLDLRIRTNKNYEWFREETGDKRLVLFDTSMYKVKRIKGGPCFLHYIGDSTLAPELPINASSCAFMFAFRKDLKKINLSNFSTEGVVTTKGMFAFCSNLEELDTSLLNTESVVDYTDMFRGCKALTQLDLCRFSLQSAKRTRGMFLGCTSLKEILTTKLFDTQDVLDGYKMFERCISLPNYRNNILVQSAMARSIKDGGYLTMTSKRVLAQDIKALQS